MPPSSHLKLGELGSSVLVPYHVNVGLGLPTGCGVIQEVAITNVDHVGSHSAARTRGPLLQVQPSLEIKPPPPVPKV